jgi:EmrB/QacA subfamily drug resistance transporter
MPAKVHNHWLILVLLALAQFMVVLDSSVVNVALPSIQHAFHMTSTNLQWIVTAYTLTFGGFLLLGGRASDLYGRKKMFMAGVILFGVASLADGFAPSGGLLIVLRALQGLAGALMSPAALSIVLITYREGKERNTALSVWGAVAAGGAAAGVLLGGILTQYLGWRWNFFINVPVATGIFIAAYRMLPAHESEETHNNLDLPGAISITGAMLLLVYGLVEAPSHGWTALSTLAYFILSAALISYFIFNENRAKRPLVPLGIFKIRNLTGANITLFPVVASIFSMFFFLSLYFQEVLHYSPVRTGLSFLVVPFSIALAATNVPRFIQKIGAKPMMIAGPILIAVALFLLTRLPVNGSYIKDILPALIILGIGAGMSFVAGTITATTGIPPKESGLASGLLNTTQQIGGSLGLAILSGIAASKTLSALHHVPSTIARAIVPEYAQVQGMHTAFYVGIGFALLAALIATIVIKPKPIAVTEPVVAAA